MNKLIVAIIAIVVLAVGAAFEFSGGEDPVQAPASTNSSISQQQSQQGSDASESNVLGNYVDYSEQALSDASGTKRVVFFHASWCPTCKFYEKDIKEQGVPEGITIIEADYDAETELKERYGVTSQSTFVLLNDDGSVAKIWPYGGGLRDASELFDAVLAEG